MDGFPQHMQVDRTRTTISVVVPKGHVNSHKEDCRTRFSLSFRPGSGQTDGEGVERNWAIMNMAAGSTKEMGEGHRHDTLDDLWGDLNYRKVLGLGNSISPSFREQF